jgi:hypothetical protein
MKKLLILFVLLNTLFSTLDTIAQISIAPPQALNYQAVLRNNLGSPMTNQAVSLKFDIIQDYISGAVVYSEKHDTLTNNFGLVNLQIGRGVILSGVFSNINWGGHDFFLKIELDTSLSGNYSLMGTSQLISVPYALYAKEAGNAGPWFGGHGSVCWYEDTTNTNFTHVSIGSSTPEPRAVLEISAMDKGVLIPRLTSFQRQSIDTTSYAPNIRGLLVYDIDLGKFCYVDSIAGLPGYRWITITSNASTTAWNSNGSDLYYNSGYVGIGTSAPQTPLQVSSGDIYIENIGNGLIMKSPNGNCWRMTVDNSGNPVFTSITCP